MTKDAVQTYSLRVTQANQSELTVITLEIFLDYVNDAVNCYEMGSVNDYALYIGKARSILTEIMAALNFENAVSFNLIKIYEYVYGTLVKLEKHADMELLLRIKGMMETLLEAFNKVAASDKSPGVMENAQQIYAGLTYGKGYLNETCRGGGGSWRA
ncbi:MAG: hypothetical protein HFH14_03840 [Lachnospiraceae bacterium]|nr:hypothetical protein [Lachnospiraceae bacterium]